MTLPTKVKGYEYHVEVFNENSIYYDATTDKEIIGQMVDNKIYV